MSQRISEKDLESMCERINKKLNTDRFSLSGAYGGWQLLEKLPSGGYSDKLGTYYTTKKDLYYRMVSFLDGIKQESNEEMLLKELIALRASMRNAIHSLKALKCKKESLDYYAEQLNKSDYIVNK